MLLLGAHLSTSGGIATAFERATAINCTAFQIFSKSNRQWKANPLNPAEIEQYHQRQTETGIPLVVCHATYLLNIASSDETIWHKSVGALVVELQRCELLKIPYLVLHPGAHTGSGIEAGIARVITALDTVHDRLPDYHVKIALEIMAGQGSTMGSTFGEIATMINGCRQSERVAVCFDTCHALVAGYEFRTVESYQAMLNEFERTIGLARLKVIHLNDSHKNLGSRVDRHAHIGEGCIGLDPFGYFLNDERFKEIPFLLETPKNDDPADDIRNLEKLRGLIAPS